jgi:hypothetical protein
MVEWQRRLAIAYRVEDLFSFERRLFYVELIFVLSLEFTIGTDTMAVFLVTRDCNVLDATLLELLRWVAVPWITLSSFTRWSIYVQ